MTTDYITENICEVVCILCEYTTTNRDAIEAWNQYGDHAGACPQRDEHGNRASVWHYTNGDSVTIVETHDGNQYRYEVTR